MRPPPSARNGPLPKSAASGGAWNEWLGTGRLAVARAEIAFQAEGPEQAVEQALKAIELAQQGRRLKYETLARTILGTALAALARGEEGLAELRMAVEGANRLGTPSGRWAALAALGKALYTRGDDEGAASAYHEAAEAISGFAATLTAEHASSLLAAPSISEILSASR